MAVAKSTGAVKDLFTESTRAMQSISSPEPRRVAAFTGNLSPRRMFAGRPPWENVAHAIGAILEFKIVLARSL
jgi:hypothetical protein